MQAFTTLTLATLLVLVPLATLAQKVGIGTTTPTQTLDVNGGLRVRAAAAPAGTTGRLLGAAADGTLLAQPPLASTLALGTPQAPASLSAVPTGQGPYGVAVSPVKARAFVINLTDNTLQTFDVSGGVPVSLGTVPTGPGPVALALHPAGTRAYVTNANANTLQAYALGGGLPQSLGTVPTGSYPAAVAVNAAGTRLFVLANLGQTLAAYDASNGGVPTSQGSAPTIASPIALALHPAGTRAYVVSQTSSQLETFDLSGSAPRSLGTVATLGSSLAVAVDAAGGRAYVTSVAGSLQAFDLSGSGLPQPLGTALTGTLTGTQPQALALHPAGTRAYVLNTGDNTLQTYDVSGSAPSSQNTLPTGIFPRAVAVNAAGTRAYVANFSSNTLQTYSIGAAPALLAVDSNGTLGALDPATLPGANLLPQATGAVRSDGTSYGAPSTYAITHPGVGSYRLRFGAGALGTTNLANAVVTAALLGSSAGLLSYNGGAGYLDVFTFDAAGAAADRGFSFSLYLP